MYKGKRRNGKIKIVVCITVILALIFGGIFEFIKFKNEHFRKNTFIQGVDCSKLTVNEAIEKINKTLSEQKVSLVFTDDKQCQVKCNEFDMQLQDDSEISTILKEQRESLKKDQYSYTLESSISFSEEKVKSFLKTLPELQEENMVKPQDAHLQWNEEGYFVIEPEVYGTYINFEEAFKLCTSKITLGELIIEFDSIMQKMPKIFSDDEGLKQEKDHLNSILSTVIEFNLYDGTKYILDRQVMKEWVGKDEAGNYYIDLEQGLVNFAKNLNEKVKETSNYIAFYPTGHETPITISTKQDLKVEVDMEKEIAQIQQELEASGTYSREPIYKNTLDLSSYVEIDLTRQKVWMYYNGECILDTPCVTGNVAQGHSTPTGMFYLRGKTRNTYLRGYNNDGSRYSSYVNFWMPFYKGYGMHDASWRKNFGGNIYKTNGSHGCVNLPYKAAKTIYEHIDSTMPIIIYKS